MLLTSLRLVLVLLYLINLSFTVVNSLESLFCYKYWQSPYTEMLKTMPEITFHQGMPNALVQSPSFGMMCLNSQLTVHIRS